MKLRWVFNSITMFSLLLCVAATALWVRSDQASSQRRDPYSFDLTHKEPLYWFISNPGRLTFCRQEGKDWSHPVQHFKLLGLEYASSRVGQSSLAEASRTRPALSVPWRPNRLRRPEAWPDSVREQCRGNK